VYAAWAVSLSAMPLLNALAFTVTVEVIEMAAEYKVEETLGSEPSVVYLMLAPVVLQLNAMFWVDW